MTGKVLVVDNVASNRVIQKVKLVASQYDVETCANSAEAKTIIANRRPDLLLVNLSSPVEDLHAFCTAMRSHPTTRSIGIIGTGIADTSRARFAALDAGCSDVFPIGSSDVYMLARIRSLLRRHSALEAWQIREGTDRLLGFQEDASMGPAPAVISVVSDSPQIGEQIATQFKDGLGQPVKLMTATAALGASFNDTIPDLVIIDGTRADNNFADLFRLLSDFNTRGASSFVTHMVLYPKNRPDVGAMLLDLGADDVVDIAASEAELCLRARALIGQKYQRDALRDQIKSGLKAAVIDPLTGLHNRRFAEKQLDDFSQKAADQHSKLALMLVDIDHFKSVNDRYGHQSGDAVLREVAQRLRQNFRDVDLIARVGGEEFLVAMPNVDLDQAEFVAERLRRVIGNRPFDIGPKHGNQPRGQGFRRSAPYGLHPHARGV